MKRRRDLRRSITIDSYNLLAKVRRPGSVKKAIAQIALKHAHTRYLEKRNPVFAWEAIAECLSANLPFPGWVRSYLGQAAESIARLSRERIPRANKIDSELARALKLQGGPRFNPFLELTRPGHNWLIAHEVYTYQGRHRTAGWKSIYDQVARAHSALKPPCEHCRRGTISDAQVKRIWYTLARKVIPPHLQRKSQTLHEILR